MYRKYQVTKHDVSACAYRVYSENPDFIVWKGEDEPYKFMLTIAGEAIHLVDEEELDLALCDYEFKED